MSNYIKLKKVIKKKQFVVFLYLYYNVTKLGQPSRPWIQNLKTKYYLYNFNLATDAQHQLCQLLNVNQNIRNKSKLIES